jgi:hypothetical protein
VVIKVIRGNDRYEVKEKNGKPRIRMKMLRDHSLINSTVEERSCLLGHTPTIGKVSKRYDHSAKAELIRAKLDRWDKGRRNFEDMEKSVMALTSAALG